MGQGLNTKVVQVVAQSLGCPLDVIRVAQSTSTTSPNAIVTGASVGTELCATAAAQSCAILNDKLAKYRQASPSASWFELIATASSQNPNLQSVQWVDNSAYQSPFAYVSYSAAVVESQIDVLTGDVQILRCDIVFDCGTSLNPLLDRG